MYYYYLILCITNPLFRLFLSPNRRFLGKIGTNLPLFLEFLSEKSYFYTLECVDFMKILTKPQISALDKRTISEENITSLELMERAAQALTDAICQLFPQPVPFKIFAGPGNNGGDALAMARLLAERGYSSDVYLFNIRQSLSEDCKTNAERLLEYPDVHFTEVTSHFAPPPLMKGDVVIDGLFGSGLNRPLDGGFAAVVKYLNASSATVISIDMPSGLACEDNTYNLPEHIIHAYMTLTIQMPKLAFFLPENQPYLGEWLCLDINLSRQGIAEVPDKFLVTTQRDIRPFIKPRQEFAHKGNFGHGLLIAGSSGMAGAAILSARASLRSGIGLLTVHSAGCNLPILQTAVPEAMASADPNLPSLSTLPPMRSYQGIAIGPGVGQSNETAAVLQALLQTASQPLVIDADALNLLALHKEWLNLLPKGSILTPHPKELERLVGHCASSYDRLLRACDLAQQLQVNIVLKGAWTAVITPKGVCRFNPTGNPGMATAGSGDVLTGILLALLARGLKPEDAALVGVYLHGAAGDLAAEKKGECGMISSDIVENLPLAWRNLEKNQYLCTAKEQRCL